MSIAIISGSSRPDRQSHQVAKYIADKLASRGNLTWIFDVKENNLPLLDYVYSKHPNPGENLKKLKSMLDQTEAFIIVSPEHNGSFSGALKNSMDYFFDEYAHKLFGIVGVSTGVLGGISAVKSLQHYILRLNGIVVPEFLITPHVKTLFENGKLIDAKYGEKVDKFLDTFLNISIEPPGN